MGITDQHEISEKSAMRSHTQYIVTATPLNAFDEANSTDLFDKIINQFQYSFF